MWCLTLASGARSFHSSPFAAWSAAEGERGWVTWFDAFDYELHNRGRAA